MDQKPSHYEIHIGGLLGERLLMAFPELDARALGHVTVLVGDLPDQAALHGVLSRIESLGLELLEVHRKGPQPDACGARGTARRERGAVRGSVRVTKAS